MGSFSLLITLFMTFMMLLSSSPTTTTTLAQISTISASPALLPNPPPLSSPSPNLSPDVTPLFPSPGTSSSDLSPSGLPTIPSNPSPPNPDEMDSSDPMFAVSPSMAPMSSDSSTTTIGSLKFSGVLLVLLSFSAFWN